MPIKPPRRLLVSILWIALGAGLSRVVPPEFKRAILLVGIPSFLVWLGWDTYRSKRELAAHLERLEKRKKENREAKENSRRLRVGGGVTHREPTDDNPHPYPITSE
jgi:threonine/homoserine/homoserine lactone efflux protein